MTIQPRASDQGSDPHPARTADAVYEALTELMRAHDLRCEQQFRAYEKTLTVAMAASQSALAAATAASEKALTVAMAASEKALTAALDAQKQAAIAALDATRLAIIKAESATERRFEAVNEWREAMNDRERNLMPRIEADNRLGALSSKVADLTDRVNATAGRSSGIGDSWKTLVALVAALAAIISTVVLLANR